jgi:hypothetical protein
MTRTWESLYSKNGLAAKYIAKELLYVESGGRIPRVTDFCENLLLGRGTVQGAIKLLEGLGAIELESRGHLGTYLMRKDDSVLLDIADIGPLIGAMPLPYSKKYEGLATGIVDAFEKNNKRVSLAYMRGASNRIEAVKTRRYDFAIVSRMAAEEGLKVHKGLEIIKTLGSETYVTGHKIFFADKTKIKIEPRMRIGIDKSSPDQSKCTLYECKGLDVELVELNYMQLFQMLKEKQIDAAVWNMDELRSVETFNSADFQSAQARELTKMTSEAVIVIDSARTEVSDQIDVLDTTVVREEQKKVEQGIRFPRY